MMTLGTLTVMLVLDEDGRMLCGLQESGDLALVQKLGLLEMAKDTLLRDSRAGGDDVHRG